jgi:beta-mannanase
MNLPRSPWGTDYNGNTPALFIAAWRHVVTLFRREKATNVRWAWSPNVDCLGNCPFGAYYPGTAWVDDVALDGYKFAGAHGVHRVSFANLFRQSYEAITALSDRPVMIAETAAPEVGGNKAAWIRQAFLHAIPTMFPRLVAVIWWDRQDATADWRVNSSVASLQSWRQVTSSPMYATRSR